MVGAVDIPREGSSFRTASSLPGQSSDESTQAGSLYSEFHDAAESPDDVDWFDRLNSSFAMHTRTVSRQVALILVASSTCTHLICAPLQVQTFLRDPESPEMRGRTSSVTPMLLDTDDGVEAGASRALGTWNGLLDANTAEQAVAH